MVTRLASVVLLVATLLLVAPAGAAVVTRTETLTESAAVGRGEKVNINTADVKELMSLAGIGQKVAERIVEYRETHGAFKKAEDVRKVEGIGPALFEKNRARIVVK